MPQRSYEWSAIDYATASEIANLINDAHLIARDVVRLSENRLRYSRVRDLMTAEKAPARLSELFTICAIVGVSPVEVVSIISQRAALIKCGSLKTRFEYADKVNEPSQDELENSVVIDDPTANKLMSKIQKDGITKVHTELSIPTSPESVKGLFVGSNDAGSQLGSALSQLRKVTGRQRDMAPAASRDENKKAESETPEE